MTNRELIKKTAERLSAAGLESSGFEAEQLVEHCGGDAERLETAVKRRLNREPLQYILGEWEFYGLPFYVGEGVLIPRPDTETAVEEAIKILENIKNPTVFDLCAGSGCIGITIAKKTDVEVKMFEKSPIALEYLLKNLRLNGVNAEALEYDVLGEPYGGIKADLIVSNPPYIRPEVIETLEPEVRKEPVMALDGGGDGLLFYRHITAAWKRALKPDGWLLFEIGFDQAEEVTKIMQAEGFCDIRVIKDFSHNDRVVLGHI